MNKVRYLTKKKSNASLFLALRHILSKVILIFFSIIIMYSSCFSLNYNEISRAKKNLPAENFFYLVQQYDPTLLPKTNLTAIDGKVINLKEYRGKLLILYFWATWCNACIQELELLQKLKEELNYRERNDIEILAISIDFKPWEKASLSLPISKIKDLFFLIDQKKQLMGELAVTSLPTSFLVDPEGYVILRNESEVAWNSLDMVSGLITLKDELNQKRKPYSAKNESQSQPGLIINNSDKKQPMLIH